MREVAFGNYVERNITRKPAQIYQAIQWYEVLILKRGTWAVVSTRDQLADTITSKYLKSRSHRFEPTILCLRSRRSNHWTIIALTQFT